MNISKRRYVIRQVNIEIKENQISEGKHCNGKNIYEENKRKKMKDE